ncbi:molybdopterin molybdochelatase /molybdenum cofactor cytidylyltransferase [Limimonas halophila]|uniref:Molybdopterin molybdochelatase /molybdenum cofactor cytidylyltransferase n=1 Tax=Limimonas halophila TaxID=1082479 RepID=A0A1G7NU66_9PROT|nr:molybdopterin-binding/glycosyltransferase family 2 protein [Limimonas halophila]SDF77473.1 molybdopterin molybdochelatase /molybdenum cofactor cytidylyltransferase [Limimonas halophila]
MRFGTVSVAEAEGTILAHSQQVGDTTFKKGRHLSAADVVALRAAGVNAVIAARLEDGDLDEDAAARRMAEACQGANMSASTAATGRVNLFAEHDGVLVYDRTALDRVNGVDEAVTIAALEPYARVGAGQIVATIKIIPIAVPAATVAQAAEMAAAQAPSLLRVAPFRARSAGLVQTTLPGTRDKVLAKTTETVRTRLESLGSTLAAEERTAHTPDDVAGALSRLLGRGCDLILMLGASATVDRRDTLPAAIEQAGGTVERFGMPVDPGNLLVLGYLEGAAVLGMPGSARSPRIGGNDWVLWRLCAGFDVTSAEIARMGSGGRLKEIHSRPLPRTHAAPASTSAPRTPPRIAGLVLAAGQSRRAGDHNKLLAAIDGTPLVRRTVDTVLASHANPVTVVTGHDREAVEAALNGAEVATVYNPDHASGMASSLRTGVKALPPDIDGVVVVLADMPDLTATVIDRLVAAFAPDHGAAICVPTWQGKRGNPVLFAKRFLPEMLEIEGDVGAKPLLHAHAEAVREVAMPDAGILHDLDTAEALAAYTRSSAG